MPSIEKHVEVSMQRTSKTYREVQGLISPSHYQMKKWKREKPRSD